MVITIDGMRGAIDTRDANSGADLALTLLQAGYSVRVNGLRVVVFYGPGYDYTMWDEGDYKGEPVFRG